MEKIMNIIYGDLLAPFADFDEAYGTLGANRDYQARRYNWAVIATLETGLAKTYDAAVKAVSAVVTANAQYEYDIANGINTAYLN